MNYLALIGWSPGGDDDEELLPIDELARRFSLDARRATAPACSTRRSWRG